MIVKCYECEMEYDEDDTEILYFKGRLFLELFGDELSQIKRLRECILLASEISIFKEIMKAVIRSEEQESTRGERLFCKAIGSLARFNKDESPIEIYLHLIRKDHRFTYIDRTSINVD